MPDLKDLLEAYTDVRKRTAETHDPLGRRLEPLEMPHEAKVAIQQAYGLLWCARSHSRDVQRAQHILLGMLSPVEQKAAIEWCKHEETDDDGF